MSFFSVIAKDDYLWNVIVLAVIDLIDNENPYKLTQNVCEMGDCPHRKCVEN